jgi:Tol biopolymer transport system component
VAVIAANNGNSDIFISRGGALVTGGGTSRAQLSWIGRDGKSRPISDEIRNFLQPRLSPDGHRLAVIISDGSKGDVWIHDLETGTLSRVTTVETVTSVEWTRDGSRVVYSAGGFASRAAIWAQSVDAASPPEKLFDLGDLTPTADISPDQHWLVLQQLSENGWRILKVALDSAPRAKEFSVSKGSDLAPRFSPDGHWVAIASNESGASQVYIRSFPEPTVKTQVSAAGGSAPVWSADGTRLYYAAGGSIMEARLAFGPGVRVVGRDTAFAPAPNGNGPYNQANFDVSRDGSRIVIPVSQSQSYQLIVVPNWITEFRARMAAATRK